MAKQLKEDKAPNSEVMSQPETSLTEDDKAYWRSFSEYMSRGNGDETNALDLKREFPEGASELRDPVTRRTFLKLMGSSMALAGLASCRRPVEKIVPYVKAPENIIPGKPLYYATTMPVSENAFGVVVESHEGRPTKIEGNKKHPASLGATNAHMQAAILGLYDPDRSKAPMKEGVESSWQEFTAFWQQLLATYTPKGGRGLAVLSEPFASPTLERLKRQFLLRLPGAKWAHYEPISDENVRSGFFAATGKAYRQQYRLDRARLVLSLEADFLGTDPLSVLYTKQFSKGRDYDRKRAAMNRLYAVESSYTLTGAMADHRLRLASSQVGHFVVALANELRLLGAALPVMNIEGGADSGIDYLWVKAVAKDLWGQRRRSLIMVGNHQPGEVHALVYLLNSVLGNVNRTVLHIHGKKGQPANTAQLQNLVKAMHSGRVSTLVIFGGNPVYNTPADFKFAEALAKVKNRVHFGGYQDETAKHCTWHLPRAHFLESWGDTRNVDGDGSVMQPLIQPLFKSSSDSEFLALMLTGKSVSGHKVVRRTWQLIFKDAKDFEAKWQRGLHDGVFTGLEADGKVERPKYNEGALKWLLAAIAKRATPTKSNMELVFRVSAAVHDGRYANNAWLQELPDPVTKISWDNVAIMSPKTAASLGVRSGDMVALSVDVGADKRQLSIPAWIQPGHADNSIAIDLGYGRTKIGRVGNGVGANAYALRTSQAPYVATGVKVKKMGGTHMLANAQEHGSMEGRPLYREATLAEFVKNPAFASEMVQHPPLKSLWQEHEYKEGYQWGMAIDLNRCTGCNACVVACQSENNIPVVGKEQVHRGREMHWIRIDRYFTGSAEDPRMVMQPVTCHHCENAPCEQVCPVNATTHDEEGLNAMVYNRCIGTRYCSNNCPYKVRRFNFFNYTNDMPEVEKMAQNPDVTIRFRGVMEKCTFCVQRINAGKIDAKNKGRLLMDGEVETACQQACPADAIHFGNINDAKSKITHIKKDSRNYALLAELNTKPRTTYMAKLRNPNPKLKRS